MPAGNMYVRYRVLGTLDFVNLHYIVVFNTSGNGVTPLGPGFGTTYLNYSFILVFGGTQAGGAAYTLLQVIPIASGGYQTVILPPAPQFVTSFNANSSGTGNEFTFTFNRLLLSPLQNASPSPSPAPSTSATAIPTLASGVSSLWAINLFSADANNNPIDAISNNGIADTTFNSYVINTLAAFDVVVQKPVPPPVTVANPNAQIIAAEIINQP